MDRFNVVANTVRVRVIRLVDWPLGCAHGRTSFPMTLRASVGPTLCCSVGSQRQ